MDGIKDLNRFFAVFAVVVLLLAEMSPVIAQESGSSGSDSNPDVISAATVSALGALGQTQSTNTHLKSKTEVDALLNATESANRTDTDGDGLYDSVERVLGTDLNNPDSDFDNLTDYYEVKNDLDPLNPDSNNDGMADYFEVTDVPPDIDGDGIWDANDPEPLVSSVATPTPTPSPTTAPTEPAVTPTPSPAPTALETTPEIDTPQPEESRPGISLELITWIFLLLAALLISGYVLLRRRR